MYQCIDYRREDEEGPFPVYESLYTWAVHSSEAQLAIVASASFDMRSLTIRYSLTETKCVKSTTDTAKTTEWRFLVLYTTIVEASTHRVVSSNHE
jgi:hypothetical protein